MNTHDHTLIVPNHAAGGKTTPKHIVRTSVASGKTQAFTWMALEHPACMELLGETMEIGSCLLYIAPTLQLLGETYAALLSNAKVLREQGKDIPERWFEQIHCEAHYQGELGSDDEPTLVAGGHARARLVVGERALRAIGNTAKGTGRLVMLTTATFLNILPRIPNKLNWKVFLDEALNPVTFSAFKLGGTEEKQRKSRREFFRLFKRKPDGELVARSKAEVRNIAEGKFEHESDLRDVPSLRYIAKGIVSPAHRLELLDGDTGNKHPALVVAHLVDPNALEGFAEVTFLAAGFENSMLYKLWQKVFQVDFIQGHPKFTNLHDTHADQGPHMTFHWLLADNVSASRNQLHRHRVTGEAGCEEVGMRVLDALLEDLERYFDAPFLLCLNNKHGIKTVHVDTVRPENDESLPLRLYAPVTAPSARLLPVMAHGLNAYRKFTHCAQLAVTNPNPSQGKYLADKLEMSHREVESDWRLQTNYQVIGRTAIRNWNDTQPKEIVLVSKDDALRLHKMFPGSKMGRRLSGMAFAAGKPGRPAIEFDVDGDFTMEQGQRRMETLKKRVSRLKQFGEDTGAAADEKKAIAAKVKAMKAAKVDCTKELRATA